VRGFRAAIAHVLFLAARLVGRFHEREIARPVSSRIAVALFTSAIRVDPGIDGACYLRLGILHARMGRAVASEEALRRGVDRYSDNPWLRFHLAHSLLGQQRYRDAMDAFREAIALEPTEAIFWLDLEFAVRQAGAAADHLVHSRGLADRFSDSVLAQRHLGSTLDMLDRFDESASAYRFASRAQFRAARPELGGESDATGPTALLIGPSRCGKSTLYKHLLSHPRVAPALYEEMNYWVDSREPPIDWYRSQLPPTGDSSEIVTVHTGTPYLHHREAAGRLWAACPEVKVIIVLRDPVVRAYAHYFQGRSLGKTLEPWPRLVDEWLGAHGDLSTDEIGELGDHGFLGGGVYLPGVARWSETIAPEQLLIVQSEQLFERPDATLVEVCDFLGIAPVAPAAPPSSGLHRHDTSMPAETRRDLYRFYRPHNLALEARLGRRFDWQE